MASPKVAHPFQLEPDSPPRKKKSFLEQVAFSEPPIVTDFKTGKGVPWAQLQKPRPSVESEVALQDRISESQLEGARLQREADAEAAAVAAEPDFLRTSSSTSAALSKGKAAAKKAENREVFEARKAEQARFEERRLEIDQLSSGVTEEAVGRVKALREQLGQRSPVLRERAEKAELAYQQISDEVRDSKIDPERLLSTMPTWGQTMLTIGTSINAFLQGGGVRQQGPSIFGQVQNAIARDLQIQKATLDASLKKQGVADRQRQFALGRFDEIQKQNRQAANQLTQLKLTQIAAEADTSEKVLKSANLILDYRQNLSDQGLSLDLASTGRTTTSKTVNAGKVARLKALEAGSDLDKDEKSVVRSSQEATQDLVDIVGKIEGFRKKSGGIGAYLKSNAFITEESALQGRIDGAVIKLAKAAQGAGIVTEQDAERFAKQTPNFRQTSTARKAAFKALGDGLLRKVKIFAATAGQDRGRKAAGARIFKTAAQVEKTLNRLQKVLPN